MHPDPAAEQLAALKDVLRKLMKGDTDVMANAMLRFVYKFNLHTSGAVWKDMLPRAYLWFDFMSMPQPLAGGGGMHNIAAAAASGHAGLSDHRNSVNEEDENLVLNLQLAVDSIPSCVAALDPLVVPTPVHPRHLLFRWSLSLDAQVHRALRDDVGSRATDQAPGPRRRRDVRLQQLAEAWLVPHGVWGGAAQVCRRHACDDRQGVP